MGDAVTSGSPLSLEDPSALLFDCSGVDHAARLDDKDGIHAWIPHRGDMSLLDAIVYRNADSTEIVGLKEVREGEFWIAGHFPDMPIMPGVIMVEAAAQLMCYMFNVKRNEPCPGAFLRINECTFRNGVTVGDDLYILAKQLRFGSRGYSAEVQGLVNNKIAFEAELRGVVLNERKAPGASG